MIPFSLFPVIHEAAIITPSRDVLTSGLWLIILDFFFAQFLALSAFDLKRSRVNTTGICVIILLRPVLCN